MRKVDEILWLKAAVKFVHKSTPQMKARIKSAVETHLTTLPATGDVKPLKGYSENIRRLRLSDIRIIFRHYDSISRDEATGKDKDILVLEIIDIDNRGDVYK